MSMSFRQRRRYIRAYDSLQKKTFFTTSIMNFVFSLERRGEPLESKNQNKKTAFRPVETDWIDC